MEYTKINNLKYSSFKVQTYLNSEILNAEEIFMLFNMRAVLEFISRMNIRNKIIEENQSSSRGGNP